MGRWTSSATILEQNNFSVWPLGLGMPSSWNLTGLRKREFKSLHLAKCKNDEDDNIDKIGNQYEKIGMRWLQLDTAIFKSGSWFKIEF